MVAEDEPNIVESLSFILERAGFEVLVALDGESAIDCAREQRPDLLLLDVMLPGRNGFEILKALKEGAATASIPVLMLTAKGQDRDRRTAQDLGADAFMTKPFSNREVLECVHSLLSRR
ncbi:MAG: response regulator [Gammaproteobacteria bacterium]|nr:response regulator [Gammaproteobacteria bacterium]